MLDALDDKQQLEKIIHDMPMFHGELAQDAYKRGKIKDGQVFQIVGDDDAWLAGVFVESKLCYVRFEKGVYSDRRLAELKRSGIARLLEIARTFWVPTAQMPYLPQRYQNVKTGKILFTGEAIENKLEDARHDNAVIDPTFGL